MHFQFGIKQYNSVICNTVANIMKKKRSNKELIRDIIDGSDVALSHQEIQGELENGCNRVTIYRVLDRLVEEGEVHRIVDINGVSKFAACDDACSNGHNHDHVHFSCKECGEVTCIDVIKPAIDLPEGYTIDEANFTLSGVCPECRDK